MALFYKELDNEDLARLSFTDLRKHAVRAIQNATELVDFMYAENVMQHCISRLQYDPQRRRNNNPNQNNGNQNHNQQQNQGGDRRR